MQTLLRDSRVSSARARECRLERWGQDDEYRGGCDRDDHASSDSEVIAIFDSRMPGESRLNAGSQQAVSVSEQANPLLLAWKLPLFVRKIW
jgi:hypothetical protein